MTATRRLAAIMAVERRRLQQADGRGRGGEETLSAVKLSQGASRARGGRSQSLMTSPNGSQFTPLNRWSCICRIGK